MRLSRSAPPNALRASTARAAHGLARWLVLLLLVFDQFSAPWHAHHHDAGVDGTVVAAVHADVHQSEVLAQAHAEAPDDRAAGAHATSVLRSEVALSLTWASDDGTGHVSLWPAARLTPASQDSTRLAIASHQDPPAPAYRSLRPSPQAPPWRA